MSASDLRVELAALDRLRARLRRELDELEQSEAVRDYLWQQTHANDDVEAFDRAVGGEL